MKQKALNISHSIKFLSIVLCIVFLISTTTYAEDTTQPTLPLSLFGHLEIYDGEGFMEPVSANSGSLVRCSNYKYNYEQVWQLSSVSTGVYTIKSRIGNLYLRHVVVDGEDRVVLGQKNSNTADYLWKVKLINYDDMIINISSTVNPDMYLTVNDGYVSFIYGEGTGRDSPARFWSFHEPIYKNLEAEYTGVTNTNNGEISLANVFMDSDEFGFDRYSGAYIDGTTTNVIQSCRNIGTTKIKEYDGFNGRGIVDIIHDSTLCVITTHGSSSGIQCNYHDMKDMVYTPTYIISTFTSDDLEAMSLPNNYFSNTKCVLLNSCGTAACGSESFAAQLQQKGVQVVVGFTETVQGEVDLVTNEIIGDGKNALFNQYFLHYLSIDGSVREAVEAALISTSYAYYNEFDESNYLFGLDSFVFFGNDSIHVKN